MVKTVNLTEALVKKLPSPASGYDTYKDATCPGLQLFAHPSGKRTYYLVKRVDGRPTRLLLGDGEQLNVKMARDAAATHTGKIAQGKNPHAERRQRLGTPTLGELYAAWSKHCANCKQKPKAESSRIEDRRNYDKHLKHWDAKRIATITAGDVRKLHDSIGAKRGHYAANRTLSLLKSMLYFAMKDADAGGLSYKGANPCKGIEKFAEVARDRFLRHDELPKFTAALDAENETIRDYFYLLILTGVRKSNLCDMRWADIDLYTCTWTVPRTKNGSKLTVPLTPPAVAILKRRSENATSDVWVFSGHRRGDHIHSPKDAWERIRKTSGLSDLRIHDLRRSLGSWLAIGNTSLPIIGAALGHKTAAATAIYSRLSVAPVREAMARAASTMLALGKRDQLTLDAIDVKSKPVKKSKGKSRKT